MFISELFPHRKQAIAKPFQIAYSLLRDQTWTSAGRLWLWALRPEWPALGAGGTNGGWTSLWPCWSHILLTLVHSPHDLLVGFLIICSPDLVSLTFPHLAPYSKVLLYSMRPPCLCIRSLLSECSFYLLLSEKPKVSSGNTTSITFREGGFLSLHCTPGDDWHALHTPPCIWIIGTETALILETKQALLMLPSNATLAAAVYAPSAH